MQKQIKSSPAVSVGNEIDGDWEMVSKRELTNELSSSGDSNGLNDSGVLVEKSEPEDEDGDEEEVDPSVPTFVEADILAQIKRMFKQRVSVYLLCSTFKLTSPPPAVPVELPSPYLINFFSTVVSVCPSERS